MKDTDIIILALKQIAVLTTLMLIISCGNGGGGGRLSTTNNNSSNNHTNNNSEPYISASLISFQADSDPGYIQNASVVIQDRSFGSNISNAIVSINNILLTYNPTAGYEAYEGSVSVEPGEDVILDVTIGENIYTVSTQQFSSYPTISFPVEGAWYNSLRNTVKLSGGAPTTDAVYNIAVLDANNLYGDLVWPTDTDNYFKLLGIIASRPETTYSIPENSLSLGDRFFIAGIVKGVPIPDAGTNSELIVAGFSATPITVVDATLESIEVTPANLSIPWGTSQQFKASGIFSDNSRLDLTSQVSWNVPFGVGSMSYDILGLMHAYSYNGDVSTIMAQRLDESSSRVISGSTDFLIEPPILLSIDISPSERTIAPETVLHFSASGLYEDGYSRDITSLVNWSSSYAAIATISNEIGSNGQATAVESGTTSISASLEGIYQTSVLNVYDWTSSITGNYVYLQSDTGDYIGDGQTYTYSQSDVQIDVSASGGHLTISVTGNEYWNGDFVVPDSLNQLQPGTYENLTCYPFHDPAEGGLRWSGEHRACNKLNGYFVIDNVTYTSGSLTSIDLHFEQHCEGHSPTLYGKIHWIQQ